MRENSLVKSSSTLTIGSTVSGSDEAAEQCGLVGLQNIGNTCYMNAALQALSNCAPLTNYFQTCSAAVQCRLNERRQSVARCYAQLIEDIWCTDQLRRRPVIDPSTLAAQFRIAHPVFRLNTQQDAQEFLRCFLDRLHEELAEPTVQFLEQNADSAIMTSSQMTRVSSCNLTNDEGEMKCSSACDSSTDYETAEDETAEEDFAMISADESDCDKKLPYPDLIPKIENINTPPPLFRRAFSHEALCSATESQISTDSSSSRNESKSEKQKPAKSSIVSEVFDGQILSCVECLTCGNTSKSKERFQDLSLPIPSYDELLAMRQATLVATDVTHHHHHQQQHQQQQQHQNNGSWVSWLKSMVPWGGSTNPTVSPTLEDCLSAFFVADELEGDNMYSCSNCKKLRDGKRYARLIEPLPEVLCIHLKRFRHDYNNGISKIKQHVIFPLNKLDLRPYLASSDRSSGKSKRSRRYSTSENGTGHETSSDTEAMMDVDEASSSEYSSSLRYDHRQINQPLYDLVALVQHDGVPAAGHYTAICRNEPSGLWYEYDDDCCTEMPIEKVLKSQAYVLFYRRRPDPSAIAFLRQLGTITPSNISRTLILAADHRERLTCQPASKTEFIDDTQIYNSENYIDNAENEMFTSRSKKKRRAKSFYKSRRTKRNRDLMQQEEITYNRNNYLLTLPDNVNPCENSLLMFYVSKKWLVRLMSFALPGEISNFGIFCVILLFF